MILFLLFKPSLWKTLTPYSGYSALCLLILVLSLNPLIQLFMKAHILRRINIYRREIGIACFSYAFIHFICFAIKRGSLSELAPYLIHPVIGPGFIALMILALLTATSNNWSIKKLTSPKWKKLHKKVYIAEGMILIHLLLLGDRSRFWSLVLLGPLFILQALRKIKRKQREKRLKSPSGSNLPNHEDTY